jgi:hypothetical protein
MHFINFLTHVESGETGSGDHDAMGHISDVLDTAHSLRCVSEKHKALPIDLGVYQTNTRHCP